MLRECESEGKWKIAFTYYKHKQGIITIYIRLTIIHPDKFSSKFSTQLNKRNINKPNLTLAYQLELSYSSISLSKQSIKGRIGRYGRYLFVHDEGFSGHGNQQPKYPIILLTEINTILQKPTGA